MVNENTNKIRKMYDKIKFEMKLRRMDKLWHFYGANSWDLFPPSFYYRHTTEEIERITEETFSELQAVIDKYAARLERIKN